MVKKALYLIVFLGVFMSLSTVKAQKTILKFNQNNKFRIVQFTDTHIKANDKESQVTFATINKILDKEKPDLVVFTGDIVTGPPLEKGWKKATEAVIKRQIPFAVVFGNHDDENGLTRGQLSQIIEPMPYGLFVSTTENISGNGNYLLTIKSSTGKKTAALLYCMDSNAYSSNDSVDGYGWFHADQIGWYRAESKKQKELNNGSPVPALAFFHIPLPEFREAYSNEKYPPVGLRLEEECPAKINPGMYAAMLESGDILGIFVGHDHNNDYLAYLHGLALAYGRFTGSKTTYGDLPNGGRVIELTEGCRTFKTWIRTGTGEVYCQLDFPGAFINSK